MLAPSYFQEVAALSQRRVWSLDRTSTFHLLLSLVGYRQATKTSFDDNSLPQLLSAAATAR